MCGTKEAEAGVEEKRSESVDVWKCESRNNGKEKTQESRLGKREGAGVYMCGRKLRRQGCERRRCTRLRDVLALYILLQMVGLATMQELGRH